MTRLKFITIALAVLALIFTGPGSVLLYGVARGDDGEPCDECQQYTIMKLSPENLQRWVEAYNSAPTASMSVSGVQLPGPTGSFDLLDYLEYTPSERDQGYCGNCWAWAGTGVMEIALDVQNGINDRLSIQYLNSNYNGGSGQYWACCGGRLIDLADFYTSTGKAIPWSNTNANWQDGSRQCSDGSTSVPAGSISTTPYYTITSIEAQTINTLPIDGVTDEATAIANIKNVLDQNQAVSFTYFMATDDDWDGFIDFWENQDETEIWNPDDSCDHICPGPNVPGHSVLCVGYNDEAGTANDYWIMVNSWGTASGGRPNGIFRLDMHMDYDCTFYLDPNWYYSFYWQTLDIEYYTPPTEINIVSKDSDNAVNQITFPPGQPGATISTPFNNVDTFTDHQILSGTDSEPVVRLWNTSSEDLLVWLGITGWENGVVTAEDYKLVASGTNVNVVDEELSADGSANSVNTGVTIANGGHLDLYLEVVLGSSEGLSGTSMLTILGEIP